MLSYLHQHGIGPIINYAAEDDITASPSCSPEEDAHAEAELALDRSCEVFRKSIHDAANTEGLGFMAIKVRHS